MSLRREQAELMCHDSPDVLFADGFDDCIIGVLEPGPNDVQRIVYDLDAMVRQLVADEEMTHDEALEYLMFNTVGAYVGPYTPLYIWTEELP